MRSLSAVIITFNEEKNIGRCLDSLSEVADEIIVVDSFSTDDTVSIAKMRGAIVLQQGFLGYIRQKNSANTLASCALILSIDADEVLSDELIESIKEVKNAGCGESYKVSRCSWYIGKFIKHGGWYPDKKLRLFSRGSAYWGGTEPHEHVIVNNQQAKIQCLKGDILHYSFGSIEQHLKKSDLYSTLSAQSMHAKGRKSSWFKIFISPFWTFLYGYFFRLGFLDGLSGFVIAINNSHATFLKYIKLLHLQRRSLKAIKRNYSAGQMINLSTNKKFAGK